MTTLKDIDRMLDNGECFTVSFAAELLYPGITFDTALPQEWVNNLLDHGDDIRGKVVFAYPEGCVFGIPYPITTEGANILRRHGCNNFPKEIIG